MPGSDLVIDHVTVAGSDLKAMQAHLASVGLRSEYGGPHSNHATEMALTSFPDGSYLELIAVANGADDKAVAAHYWSKELRGNAGPCAWAIRAKDLAPEAARIKKTGTVVTDPVRAGRERPDGVRLDWETANIGAEPNGTFFPFMIHDLTPRERRAYPSGEPTTQARTGPARPSKSETREGSADSGSVVRASFSKDFSGVSLVVVGVRNIESSIARYRKAFGLPEPRHQSDPLSELRLARFPDTPVILATPLASGTPLAKRLEQFGEGPYAFVLHAHVKSGYPTSGSSRWFGYEILWADSAKLGWPLGFESQ